jgi:hypothetical protein
MAVDVTDKTILEYQTERPKPFVWKASADIILDKVRRCKELSRTGD